MRATSSCGLRRTCCSACFAYTAWFDGRSPHPGHAFPRLEILCIITPAKCSSVLTTPTPALFTNPPLRTGARRRGRPRTSQEEKKPKASKARPSFRPPHPPKRTNSLHRHHPPRTAATATTTHNASPPSPATRLAQPRARQTHGRQQHHLRQQQLRLGREKMRPPAVG